MIIGVPKEIKNNENRVGMTPAGVAELVKKGHTVYMQATAGINSGFSDDDYIAVGAQILPAIEDVYAIADMIVKVKEPIAPEYKLIKKGQVVFTYFHFAADKVLTEAMIESGAVCIAYETVEKEDHSLPLLTPMSEVAGRMATQVGARFLEKPQGGKGKLMGGVPGVRPARVLILAEDYDFGAHQELVPMQPGDVPVTYADTSALERDFGYKPSTDLRTGLRKFAEWYADFYK